MKRWKMQQLHRRNQIPPATNDLISKVMVCTWCETVMEDRWRPRRTSYSYSHAVVARYKAAGHVLVRWKGSLPDRPFLVTTGRQESNGEPAQALRRVGPWQAEPPRSGNAESRARRAVLKPPFTPPVGETYRAVTVGWPRYACVPPTFTFYAYMATCGAMRHGIVLYAAPK